VKLRTAICALLGAGSICNAAAREPAAAAAPATQSVKLFVGCPVYRDSDSGRKSGCWLVTDLADGTRYDVTLGRIKPILGRKILVEGIVSTRDTNACGAPVLEPVNVSVLDAQCKAHLIPAEGHSGHRFVLPKDVMQPTHVPRKLPAPPYEPQTYTIEFELASDFLLYQYSEVILERAALFANASKARRIEIVGFAATDPVEVSGERIVEDLAIAKARAAMVAEAFARFGVAREAMHLSWRPAPIAGGNGQPLRESAKRRVEITIKP
jgi:outer membrane protein OmpA-like peptidoglycan-associated protein